jgi:myosin heavy subunit
MGILEIVLLLAGGVLAVLSFVLPVKKDEVPQETKTLAAEEIKELVDKEMDDIRQHVDSVVDEAVEYAMEKTERSLERLTNEKIMAVNEYSDTVLQEIQKNHDEAMFLYDMLNDKHDNLKSTVSEVHKTVQEVEESKREAEAVVDLFQQLKPENVKPQEEKQIIEPITAAPEPPVSTAQAEPSVPPVVDVRFAAEEQEAGNNNEQILNLYRQGKSKVAIARELGLGVGEVKLVIDLYKNT